MELKGIGSYWEVENGHPAALCQLKVNEKKEAPGREGWPEASCSISLTRCQALCI
jgi:hypothetical protein